MAEFLQYTAELKHGFNGTTIDDHAEAILRIIESEVIGEDEPTPPVTTGNIDGVTFYDQVDDMLRPGRNQLRESQREKLK